MAIETPKETPCKNNRIVLKQFRISDSFKNSSSKGCSNSPHFSEVAFCLEHYHYDSEAIPISLNSTDIIRTSFKIDYLS